jgi:hypothetical protein
MTDGRRYGMAVFHVKHVEPGEPEVYGDPVADSPMTLRVCQRVQLGKGALRQAKTTIASRFGPRTLGYSHRVEPRRTGRMHTWGQGSSQGRHGSQLTPPCPVHSTEPSRGRHLCSGTALWLGRSLFQGISASQRRGLCCLLKTRGDDVVNHASHS